MRRHAICEAVTWGIAAVMVLLGFAGCATIVSCGVLLVTRNFW